MQGFRQRLQRAVSCISSAVIVSGTVEARGAGDVGYFGLSENPLWLPGTDGLGLSLDLTYRIQQLADTRRSWTVSESSYYYALLDRSEHEVLAYHWHPHVEGVSYPHLHISPGAVRGDVVERAGLSEQANALRADLTTAHLPTGPAALESVLWLAIAQLGAAPLRSDWRRLLPAPD